ncbi:MAG TPA: four-helix bundle copper-binding protein [Pirellulales bacterium]|nr:four-helix bundle copper-binding protein [Pirellulales bacterium]
MDRRHMLGTVAAGVASLGFVEAKAFAADDEKHAHEGHNAGQLQKCMDTCVDCMNECNMTVHYCYERSLHGTSKFMHALHLAMDCQEFCGNSAKLIARASPLMNVGCQACAEACDKCAAECEKHGDDEQLARCAKECRTCAKSCRDMIAHMGQQPSAAKDKTPAR